MDAWNIPCLRIGHGGASAHAPANSLLSLKKALELGVDMVEFDVRPCRDALVLRHDEKLSLPDGRQGRLSGSTLDELRSWTPDPQDRIITLEQALDLIKGRALVNVDVKDAGYEAAVVEKVCAKGMGGDVLYSSLYPHSLLRIRQADPGSKTGLSYPEDKGNSSGKPYLKPAVDLVLVLMRLTLSLRVLKMMTGAGAQAVMLYHKVVSRRTIRTVQDAGGKVFTWTIDDARRILELRKMGVNGIASNRPELFQGLSENQ